MERVLEKLSEKELLKLYLRFRDERYKAATLIIAFASVSKLLVLFVKAPALPLFTMLVIPAIYLYDAEMHIEKLKKALWKQSNVRKVRNINCTPLRGSVMKVDRWKVREWLIRAEVVVLLIAIALLLFL